ncbi:MAG: phosphate acyltransferase PlsX [Planctomycetes bacterium]|nr:phosphate acyltransferase PlsX [Planctomycetota bacterium]
MPRIAVDAMGGDNAPGVVVRGAYKYAQTQPDHQVILVGIEDKVAPVLAQCGPALKNISLVHAPDVIGMDEHPRDALRKKKHNSLSVGCDLIRQGKADAVLSAGNTGGLVMAATVILRTLPGVMKAGIATTLPTVKGRIVMMDVGANVETKPNHLLQYAAMGEIFYRALMPAREKLRVGLLTVGSEEGKGSTVIREAHALLTQSGLSFSGNCEGNDIFEGNFEVVVCDGELGNVVLKTAEGIADAITKLLMGHVKAAELATDPRWAKAAGGLMKDIDWRDVGGAVLLGVGGTVVISHGRSDERAIFSGIRVAAECCQHKVNEQIVKVLESQKAKSGAGVTPA